MGLLDDAIREHLDLKRRRGADPAEVEKLEREALGPVRRGPEEPLEPDFDGEALPTADEHGNGAYDHEDELGWDEELPEGREAGFDEDEFDSDPPIAGAVAPPEYEPPVAPEQPAPEPRVPEPSHARENIDPQEPHGHERAEPHEPPPPPAEEWDREGDLFAEEDDPHPTPHPAHGSSEGSPHLSQETAEYHVEAELEREDEKSEDVLEETPEFLQDTPDHDRLWFEQRPPRDFDFDG